MSLQKLRFRYLILAAFCVVVIAIAADFAGLFPSVSKALGTCNLEANSRLSNLRRYDDKPVDNSANIEWYGKHAELVTACMKSSGYSLDQRAIANHVTRFPISAMAYARYQALQIESFWSRRFIWE